MVNKCAVFGCKRGYESEEPQHEDYHAFYFPLDERKSHLLPAWEKFVCRDGWKPSANSVICEFHFEDRLIRKGKRWTLKWKLNPMPTMLTDEMKTMPQSVQPTLAAPSCIYDVYTSCVRARMRARVCVWFGMHLYVYKYC